MDIEWAVEEGKIYVVQARPVTTLKSTKGEDMARGRTHAEGELKKSGKILVKGLAAIARDGRPVRCAWSRRR